MQAQVLEYLRPRAGGCYLDLTCGLGGHTGAIARKEPGARIISLDRDAESLRAAQENCRDCAERIVFRKSRFSEMDTTLSLLGVSLVDGIVADLGVSRYQLVSAERGFSLLENGPIDMRMDREQELTAAELVNRLSERELSDLFFQLGNERRAGRVARAILRARPLRDTAQLADVVASAVPRQGKLHPATLVFQALRMAVNDEPAELDAMLSLAPDMLKPGGRFVVIAFHSGEDRKVKQSFRTLAREGRVRVLTKHVVRPDEAEVRENPASRSAVLRAVETRMGGSGGDV